MASHIRGTTIRRSVAIPADLVTEALELARKEKVETFNGLVRTLLERFVHERKMAALAVSLAEMAHDPAIQKECRAISHEFARAEDDGLAAAE